jgi:hypothetical protein
LVRRNREHTERFPAELPLVLSNCEGRKVPAHLTLKARLGHIGASDRHGASVDFDHEAPARAVWKANPKHKVGHNADFLCFAFIRNGCSQRERIWFTARPLGV